jgi:uncharacterized RDD family membrane protein YckC
MARRLTPRAERVHLAAMFIIMGGDGKEYGPVTVEQIRTWIRGGRANLETKAKALGSDEWRSLADFAEFSSPDGLPPVIAPVAEEAADPALAHRGIRLLAALVDGFIESLCWMPTTQAVMKSLGGLMAAGQMSPQDLVEVMTSAMTRSIPYLAGLVLVQATLLTVRGQTIGKILTRIRVVRARDGSPAGFLHGFLLRGFVPRCLRHVPLVGMLFWLVDNCFIFREDQRCLHDLMAGTKVVKV